MGTRRLLLGIVACALLGAACSGSSDAGAPATTTTATSTTSTAAKPTTTANTTAKPAGTAGCGKAADPGPTDDPSGDVTQAITSLGQQRTYRLALPAGYDPAEPYPLVFDFHGSGSTASQQTVYSGLPKAGHDQGLIVVTPDGIDGAWQLSAEPGETASDIQLVKDLLTDIEGRFCVDTSRRYAVGMSLGALMAASVVCSLPGTFAAVGLVTVEIKPVTCEPIPMVAFHGTADPVVPYGPGKKGIEGSESGVELPGVQFNMAAWAKLDGCDPTAKHEKIGADVDLQTYGGCTPGTEVSLYSIDGGGHTWPGSKIKLSFGKTTDTVDATKLILALFARHTSRP